MGRNIVKFLAYPAMLSLAACASSGMKPETEAALQSVSESAKLREQVEALNARVDSLEGKLTSMSDKVDAAKLGVEHLASARTNRDVSVPAPPTESAGVPVEASTALSDPEAGLTNDNAIQAYRQAMILFKAEKFPEALLAFSSFIERHADHPLAGSAQFHVGEAYFRQKEYRLAIVEFQRVLTSYDRSSAVPETLKQMAQAEEHARQAEDALKHRQLLLSLFPQSPAARSVELAQTEAPAPEQPQEQNAETSAAPAAALDAPPPTAPISAAPEPQAP